MNLSAVVFNILLFIIYMFMVLIFIEFIELNFLGLSTMTERNIDLRTKLEMENKNNVNDLIIGRNVTFHEYEEELKYEKE